MDSSQIEPLHSFCACWLAKQALPLEMEQDLNRFLFNYTSVYLILCVSMAKRESIMSDQFHLVLIPCVFQPVFASLLSSILIRIYIEHYGSASSVSRVFTPKHPLWHSWHSHCFLLPSYFKGHGSEFQFFISCFILYYHIQVLYISFMYLPFFKYSIIHFKFKLKGFCSLPFFLSISSFLLFFISLMDLAYVLDFILNRFLILTSACCYTPCLGLCFQ